MIDGFAQLQPTAPLCAPAASPPQYGAASMPPQQPTPAVPRQVMVTVPQGTMPGQPVQFTTPEGIVAQVQVPAGFAPGQQFMAQY